MDYVQLQNVNKLLRTMDVKGRAYVEVNERIRGFRCLFPNGFIKTDIIQIEDGVVTMQARVGIYDDKGEEVVFSTGYAQEKESSSYINKTSYIENCETSAVGRALGMLGIGIDTSVASAEEVQNAINNQNRKETKPAQKLPTEDEGEVKIPTRTPTIVEIQEDIRRKRIKHIESNISEENKKKTFEFYNVKSFDELSNDQVETVFRRLNGGKK